MVSTLTVRKLLNTAFFLKDFFTEPELCLSNPLYIKIEPTNRCDHQCPKCATLSNRAKGFMNIETYRRIIGMVQSSCMRLCLYGQGESFLHPQIFEMIRFAERRKCSVFISSNFNSVSGDRAKLLLDSGLNYLTVCIDGATQQSHSRYRKNGNLSSVLDNLRNLIKLRSQGNYSSPTIEIQTVAFDYIKNEIPEISKMISDIGVDVHCIRKDMFSGLEEKCLKKNCPYPWGALFVTWDGKMYPCEEFCNDSRNEYIAFQEGVSLSQLRHSNLYIQTRKILKLKDKRKNLFTYSPCLSCMHFR
jgi:radical SAM protein with 4Fe4S-binding SPASM domain